jgi:ADP-heptose:LPS heptosyltransferase
MTAPSKVLVTILDNLGDTVMATAVLRPLRRALPGARIGMFVKKYAAGVLMDHSMIDRLHAADPFWDASPAQAAGGMMAFLRTINEIRRERYDAALVLNTEWRRAAAMMAARVPRRIGYNRRRAEGFLTDSLALADAPAHFIDDHRRLAEILAPAVMNEEFSPRLELAPGEADWVDQWRRSGGWSDGADYAVIHPFSGDERKNWPLERWISLVNRLRRQVGGRFVVVCAANEEARLAGWMAASEAGVRFLVGAPSRRSNRWWGARGS